MTVRANGKINLSLDVLGRREDGMHEMRTVIQAIAMGDSVTLTEDGLPGIRCSSNVGFLPNDERNNCVRLLNRLGISGVALHLEKRLPVCGGLGGSSADTAAILRILTTMGLYDGTAVDASEFGADVPFLLHGGCALCEGIGEQLTSLPPLPPCGIVIIKPRFSAISAELFAAIDMAKPKAHPYTDGLINALVAGDLHSISRLLFNVFEEVLPLPYSRMVTSAKRRLLDCGALGAVMSGSGASVFGLFDSIDTAKRAFLTLHGRGQECYLTVPVR